MPAKTQSIVLPDLEGPIQVSAVELIAQVIYDTDEDMLDEIIAERVAVVELHAFETQHPRLSWVQLGTGIKDKYLRRARAVLAALYPADFNDR